MATDIHGGGGEWAREGHLLFALGQAVDLLAECHVYNARKYHTHKNNMRNQISLDKWSIPVHI